MWWIYGGVFVFLGLVFIYYFDNMKYWKYSKELKPTNRKHLIEEKDLDHLPKQIKNYLMIVGVVGKEKPVGMRLLLSGEMKANRQMDFAKAKAKQTSMFGSYKRYFYIELSIRHILVKGLHIFHHGAAVMKIKVLGIFRVVHGKGPQMNQAETVTVFNDLCLLAPHALIDANVTYEEKSESVVVATFTNEGISIQAKLFFDQKGRLINFISKDRYYSQDGKENIQVPWSTPIYEYKKQNGYYLPYKGDAVWMFEEGPFTYFKLTVEEIKYYS